MDSLPGKLGFQLIFHRTTAPSHGNRNAFFWVKLLAAMPRFVAQTATAEMMSGSNCAWLLPVSAAEKLTAFLELERSQTRIISLPKCEIIRHNSR